MKTYTESELKTLVLNQVNQMESLKAPFGSSDATEAWDSAVRECGFEIPLSTEESRDQALKFHWLYERMMRWYLNQLLMRNLFKFDVGEMKANAIVKNFREVVKKMDEEFMAAKESVDQSHLFLDADVVFGENIVISTGFIEDRIGQSIEERTE